jgi:hypothetical protein
MKTLLYEELPSAYDRNTSFRSADSRDVEAMSFSLPTQQVHGHNTYFSPSTDLHYAYFSHLKKIYRKLM